MIYKLWDHHWDDLCEFFKYPIEIRKVIYTINAVESLNHRLSKVLKNRSTFSTDEAIFRILYLALRNASNKRMMPIKDWGRTINQFAIKYGTERVPF